MNIFASISYREYVIFYFVDRTYISCFADVLIISAILFYNGAFLASQEFFETRKNECIASGNLQIHSSVAKLKSYLYCLLIFNFLFLLITVWIFWPVEFFLLFLLNYKVSLYIDIGNSMLTLRVNEVF
jgi:hypothetical protein